MADGQPIRTPHIRGQERADLVDDLAQGDLLHEQLAAKYGRTLQTIREFSARNHAEIQGRRRELHGALAEESTHRWVADKGKLSDRYQDMIDELTAELQDTEDLRLKSRLARDIAPLLHAVGDLHGLFPMRSRVDLDVKTPFRLGDVLAFGRDGQLHEVRTDDSSSAGA
jgi:hypothetical protein